MTQMTKASLAQAALQLWRKSGPFLLSAIAILALGLPSAAIQAHPTASIHVTTTADEWDEGEACSLREAIQAANTDTAFGGCPAGSGPDVIELPAGTYTFAVARTGFYDSPMFGDLDLDSDITINGAGQATTIIDAAGKDRVLEVLGHTVELNHLTLTGGHPPDGDPGADGVAPGDEGEFGGVGESGGGIYNRGTLTLNHCRVSANQAGDGGSGGDGYGGLDGSGPGDAGTLGNQGGNGGSPGDGGGIYNEGTLTLNFCTIEGNQTGQPGAGGEGGPGGAGGSGAEGGTGGLGGHGIWGGAGGGIYSGGPTVLNDTIVQDNRVADSTQGGRGGTGGRGGNGLDGKVGETGGEGGSGGRSGGGGVGGDGGGIYSEGQLVVTRCTITRNQAGKGGRPPSGGPGGKGGHGGDSTGKDAPGGSGGAGGKGGGGHDSGAGGVGGGIWASGGLQLTKSEVSHNRAGDAAQGSDGGKAGPGGDGGDSLLGVGGSGGSGGVGGSGRNGRSGGRAGGISVYGGELFVLVNSSINDNVAGSGGDGGDGGLGGQGGGAGSPSGAKGESEDGGSGGAGGIGGGGGGLRLSGSIEPIIDGCTIGQNVAGDGGQGGDGGNAGAQPGDASGGGGAGDYGGDGGDGGGLDQHLSSVTTSLVNTTFSGNLAGSGGDGGDGGTGPDGPGAAGHGGRAGSGGGIHNDSTVKLYNCTIVANQASGSGGQPGTGSPGANPGDPGTGGGLENTNAISLAHTLLANNTASGQGPDCQGSLDSEDYNLIESIAGCTVSGDTIHNILGLDPSLAPLANNGGQTETYALLPGSPALDGGAATCYDQDGSPLSVDQRQRTRPVDGDDNGSVLCDIGSVEMQGSFSLAVSVDGGGSGTVTSQPGGINCEVECEETYFDGTVVTLTATADVGSHLVSWAGDCSGSNPVCAVTVVADQAASATFELNLAKVFLPLVLKDN